MRVAFAGSPPAAVTVLEGLRARGHEVALVVSQPDRPKGRGGTPVPTPVSRAATELGLPLRRPAKIGDPEMRAELEAIDVPVLCVVGFGQILREPILSRWTCLNVHFSLLPAYRGAAPVERALMDGCEETGVTVMRMDEGLDTGPIIRTARVPVADDEDAGSLLHRLAIVGGELLSDVLDELAEGELTMTPQPDVGISLAPKIGDDDLRLDLSQPARRVVDRIRALSPHIGARCQIDGEPFKIWRACVADVPRSSESGWQEDGRLFLATGDGAVEVLELQPPNRSRMPADAFLRGWRRSVAVTG